MNIIVKILSIIYAIAITVIVAFLSLVALPILRYLAITQFYIPLLLLPLIGVTLYYKKITFLLILTILFITPLYLHYVESNIPTYQNEFIIIHGLERFEVNQMNIPVWFGFPESHGKGLETTFITLDLTLKNDSQNFNISIGVPNQPTPQITAYIEKSNYTTSISNPPQSIATYATIQIPLMKAGEYTLIIDLKQDIIPYGQINIQTDSNVKSFSGQVIVGTFYFSCKSDPNQCIYVNPGSSDTKLTQNGIGYAVVGSESFNVLSTIPASTYESRFQGTNTEQVLVHLGFSDFWNQVLENLSWALLTGLILLFLRYLIEDYIPKNNKK